MVSQPILALPVNEGRYLLDTDASDFGLGAVLSQEQEGCERIIAYASRTLNKAERKYETTHKELLAIVYGLKQYKQYLLGRHFVIRTDHAVLSWLRKTPEPMPQLARWLTFIEQFDYEILHRPGTQHDNADSLSRRPVGTAISDAQIAPAKVAAISSGPKSQVSVTFDSHKAAAFLYKRLPSLDDIGIKEAEVYSEQTAEFLSVRSPTPDVIGSSNSAVTQDVIPPVQVATPIVQSVKVVTRTGGGISGPAGGISPMNR